MGNVLFLTSIIGLLLILVYFSPLGSHHMNAHGSLSQDDDDDFAAADQSAQRSPHSTGTSAA
jgi:hypothetical protein